ncbi:MAG: hypothetical protein JKY65_19185, partial [Planctomycetes bacterium]|nr:hypothetical protein [Planctomycetota bacterium]
LAARLETAAAAAGAPLSQIREPTSAPTQQAWGWGLLCAGLLALLSFGLAGVRELRRRGFQDARELGDLVDLPVLMNVAPESRES